MKKTKVEQAVVVILFVAVLVVFSLAQKDTEKVYPLYNTVNSTVQSLLTRLQ